MTRRSSTTVEEGGEELVGQADEKTRTRWLWWWALACVAAVVVAFLVGTQVRSPWEAAIANSRAVEQVTAPVAQRTLAVDGGEVQGTVALGSSVEVVPRGDGPWVVTATPRAPGEAVTGGQVLVEISGRPVLGLDLPFALYRDLAPGDQGTDVKALQTALAAAGHYSGTADGEYGPATAAAVTRLYQQAGATPPAPSDDTVEAVTEAEDALTEAQDTLAGIGAPEGEPGQAGSGDAATAPDGSAATRGRAQADVDAAAAELQAARTAALQPLPMAEIVRLPGGTAQLVSVSPVGTEVAADGGPVLTLRSGAPTVTARVSMSNAPAFVAGASVTVTSVTDTTSTTTGTVTAVGEFVGSATDSGAPPGYDVTIALADPAGLAEGAAVTVTPEDALPGITGTSVPVLALREDATGTYVRTVAEDGRLERVDVELLGTADGYAVVHGELSDGDDVVVTEGE
ncbi:peptidoglycan-binding protein [Sanguibacter suaedae]|uniref:Peptidoglycan-binding protein n=1 Tax=Sanguibacter suaedae TaxID=2795737 RepID=A0A934I6H3_9MICO|nr:peptidoglycan-binding protein [Sanguibacter suaedae]MBI9115126.1 peptidoglycan-binding protein [Sanguibacter suaedae]